MSARRRGRPRDPAINDAILTATRELLLDVGYAGLSMEAVAARARVSKPTLYLRYPTKGVLVFDAVFGKTKTLAMPDTGDLRNDLRVAYEWAVDEFAAPEARAALPGILAEVSASPEMARLLRTLVVEPEYARVHDLLQRAQHRGEIRADADLPLVIDAFIGTALARATILDHPLDHTFATRLVELLVAGLEPRPGA
ncbi:MAG: TetR/AcrR family transcriptional regulator [Micromonosporaceae bacterium]